MKVGRNDPCPCGSGKKYKHCCYAKDSMKHEEPIIEAPGEPEVEEDDEHDREAAAPQSKHHHPRDRSRFQGEVRGGSSTFQPRATRGSQRGS